MVDDFIPDFTEDDEPLEPGVAAEQAQNRTFLVAAGILAAVFILGLIVAVLVVLGSRDGGVDLSFEATSNAIAEANATIAVAGTETAVAAQFTATSDITSTPTTVPTATADIRPTATQTPVVAATQLEGTAGTEVAEVATLDETQIAAGTLTPFQTMVPTGEATPLGGTDPTPTRIVSGVNGGNATAGPILPSVTALPDTGFGNETPLFTIGLMALALVAVVFAARRLRLSS